MHVYFLGKPNYGSLLISFKTENIFLSLKVHELTSLDDGTKMWPEEGFVLARNRRVGLLYDSKGREDFLDGFILLRYGFE